MPRIAYGGAKEGGGASARTPQGAIFSERGIVFISLPRLQLLRRDAQDEFSGNDTGLAQGAVFLEAVGFEGGA
jgi:hypothetical protein